jgi:tetrapyrrole methylase family protein/MazG family protein
MNKSGKQFQKLSDVVDTLMAENGCPWDRVQTHETLKPYLVEEVYETLDALDDKNPQELKDELGDLLYQIMFHAKIASNNNEFDISDVIDSIAEKMIRRHPHVFKNENLDTPDEVVEQWEEIKRTEKSNANRKSVLDGVPRQLPNLMRAQKLQKKAAKHGFDWDQITAVFDKLDEEIAEFKEAALSGDQDHMNSEMGDILFVLVNIARFQKIDAEEALRGTNKKFIRRFQYIEQEVAKQGKTLKETPLDELERYWQEAKTKAK